MSVHDSASLINTIIPEKEKNNEPEMQPVKYEAPKEYDFSLGSIFDLN